MTAVLFTAPFFLPTTVRFIDAVAGLPDVQVGLVSQDPVDRLPAGSRSRLAWHARIANGLDEGQILDAAAAFSRRFGTIHRLLGTLEELQVPLARVRERMRIGGMKSEAALNFRDKARMKDVLRAAGIPCARHRLAASDAEAWSFADECGYPLVAKPPAGAGARNTFRIDSAENLRECLGWMTPSSTQPLLLEEFVGGEEHSFDSVCIGGKLVWHSVTRYLPGPLEVLRAPWIQWCVLLPREVDDARYDAIRMTAGSALGALGMGTGLSHMEWFRRKDGTPAVSEVGARPPGAQITSLISYAHDFDLYRAWAKLMVHETFEPPQRAYAAGIAFLRGQGRGVVRRIHGLDQAQSEMADLVVEVHLPSPGQSPASGYEGEGYVILRHRETSVVERALMRVVSLVRVELG